MPSASEQAATRARRVTSGAAEHNDDNRDGERESAMKSAAQTATDAARAASRVLTGTARVWAKQHFPHWTGERVLSDEETDGSSAHDGRAPSTEEGPTTSDGSHHGKQTRGGRGAGPDGHQARQRRDTTPPRRTPTRRPQRGGAGNAADDGQGDPKVALGPGAAPTTEPSVKFTVAGSRRPLTWDIGTGAGINQLAITRENCGLYGNPFQMPWGPAVDPPFC